MLRQWPRKKRNCKRLQFYSNKNGCFESAYITLSY